MPFTLELGNEESASRLQHSIHLRNGGPSIILGDVMQGEGAGNSVERIVGERKLLCIGDLEAGLNAVLARSCSGTADHLWTRVNAIGRPARSYPLSENRGKPAGAAANIENMITRRQLQIISEPIAHPASASAEQPSPDVVNPGPVDHAVTAVAIGTTGLMHHGNLLGSAGRKTSCRHPPSRQRVFYRLELRILTRLGVRFTTSWPRLSAAGARPCR